MPSLAAASIRRTFCRATILVSLAMTVSACDFEMTGDFFGTGPSGWGPIDIVLRYPDPAPVAGGLTFASIAPASYHGCGLLAGGELRCWGGEFGIPPVAQAGMPALVSLSSGSPTTCGIDAGGTVRCWGAWTCVSPVGITLACGEILHLPDSLRFRAVATGEFHACGILDDGRAACWGAGSSATLGRSRDGIHPGAALPVDTEQRFVSIDAGPYHTCALTADGQAWCWGLSEGERTGSQGTTCPEGPCTPVPTPIESDLRFTSLALAERRSCGIATDGKVYCWGLRETIDSTAYGYVRRQLVRTPYEVPGDVPLVQLTAGVLHVCGLDADGLAYCWGGDNPYGERGTEPLGVVDRPTPVVGGRRFREIRAGAQFTCALDATGAAWCWGMAGSQLGRM